MDLESVIAENQGSLFAFLYRMCGDGALAEELMQEAFVRALQAAKRYRPQGRVSTWLFAIAANLLRDHWRRKARWGQLEAPPDEADEVTVDPDSGAEQLVMARMEQERVRAALLLLPLEQRSALILRYYHDLTYEEIAQALACPIGTVRSRIHNGLRRLKVLLMAEEAASGA